MTGGEGTRGIVPGAGVAAMRSRLADSVLLQEPIAKAGEGVASTPAVLTTANQQVHKWAPGCSTSEVAAAGVAMCEVLVTNEPF